MPAAAPPAAGPDPRVDAYIANAAPFARPILAHLRTTVHGACPQVGESIKWGMPFFVLDGCILANMAAFKQHCAFGFWHGGDRAERGRGDEAMGQFGRITALADLPPVRELKALVRLAAMQAASGAPLPRAPKSGAGRPAPAPDLAAALARNADARRHFEAFAPSKRREYVDWLTEAKQDATRARRLAQAIEWLAEGKSRHWKYQPR